MAKKKQSGGKAAIIGKRSRFGYDHTVCYPSSKKSGSRKRGRK